VIEEFLTPDVSVESSDPAKPAVRADERYALNPVERRFLFVDVAAQRAKQLRKGALNRLALAAGTSEAVPHAVAHKPERIAMEEVRRGFVEYEVAEAKPLTPPQEG
jgi:DNA-directed RNA polymerase omega subunit